MKHIARYNNNAPVKNWSNFMNDFFTHSLSNVVGSDMSASQPAVNVLETEKEFHLELAVPGLEKGDFSINVEKDTLVIEAKKEIEENKTEGKFTRREFNYTSFKRNFQLPENVEPDNIGASYEQGVLRVTLPKVVIDESSINRTIEIA